jgi:hypothetical protein
MPRPENRELKNIIENYAVHSLAFLCQVITNRYFCIIKNVSISVLRDKAARCIKGRDPSRSVSLV